MDWVLGQKHTPLWAAAERPCHGASSISWLMQYPEIDYLTR